MSKFVIAALLSSSVIAAPACAQDTGATAYSGAHVEALGGWDRIQAGGHDDGILYGVGAGYDVRRANTVFGIEGEVSDSTQKEKFAGWTEQASRDLYVGGRAGVVVGSNLLYAKAGYTNARYTAHYVAGTTSGALDGNLDGVRVGAGVEHALGKSAFVKAEYRYSNYEQGVSRHQVVGGVGLSF